MKAHIYSVIAKPERHNNQNNNNNNKEMIKKSNSQLLWLIKISTPFGNPALSYLVNDGVIEYILKSLLGTTRSQNEHHLFSFGNKLCT